MPILSSYLGNEQSWLESSGLKRLAHLSDDRVHTKPLLDLSQPPDWSSLPKCSCLEMSSPFLQGRGLVLKILMFLGSRRDVLENRRNLSSRMFLSGQREYQQPSHKFELTDYRTF